MTLKQKLNEKLETLDRLDKELHVWLEHYQNRTNFPAQPDLNSGSSKLETITNIITEMQEVAGHAEILAEVIEELKEC